MKDQAALPLLIPVGTVDVAVTTTPFVAKDRFIVNIKETAPVKISGLESNFKNWFLGKTEEPVDELTLKYGKLSRSSVDGPILKELGGEEKAETTLNGMFSLMRAQRAGTSGPLLTNGTNIFYVRDAAGVLRAVRVRWNDDGWNVVACAVAGPFGWNGGRQLFFRDFSLVWSLGSFDPRTL